MKLHIFCFVHMIFLSACAVDCIKTQQLGFWVWRSCLDLGKDLHSRDPYFIVGCTPQMICKYLNDTVCDNLNTTDLQVFYKNGNTNVHVVNKTKCSLTVEMRNVTESDGGNLCCHDNNSNSRQRTVRVGYAPVEPKNLTMVFVPKKFVALLIDRVKMGEDLKDSDTEWHVNYTWRESNPCPKEGREVDKEDGRYVACKLDLRHMYEEDGQYGDRLGSVFSPINFTVIVENMFGNTTPVFQAFRPQNYIKPNKLRRVRVNRKGSTWISVQVKFPAGIDKILCQNMSENETSELRIQYKVTSVREEEQHSYQSQTKTFHDLYGFYRNLDADKAALSEASIDSIMQRESKWPDCWKNTTVVNINGLPLADTRYNISVRAQGRYWGPWVPVENAATGEGVPEEGPKFDNSSYICFKEDQCVTCVVYFKEIPRPKRGGPVLAYHLDAAEATGSIKETLNCSSAVSQSVTGDNNTIVMTNLHPAAVYNLTFYARTRKGQSPTTSGFLQTDKGNTTLAGPQHVVIKKHDQSQLSHWSTYEVSWSIPEGAQPNQNKYYVHHCFAKELEGIRSKPRSILNCMTNLVTEQYLNSSTRIKSVSLPFYRGQSKTDLSPAFFVSVETPDGVHGSLVKPECLYAIDRAPAAVTMTVQMQSDNPQKLLLTFTHECRDDDQYRDGEPSAFEVLVAEMTSSADCSPQFLKDGQDVSHLKLFEDVQPNEKTEKVIGELKADTDYCVGVKAIKPNVDPVWATKRGKTGVLPPVTESLWIVITLLSVIPPFIVVGVLFYFCYRHSRRYLEKFQSLKDTMPKPHPKSPGTPHHEYPTPPPITSLLSLKSRGDALRVHLTSDNSQQSSNNDSGVITGLDEHSEIPQFAINSRYNANGNSHQFANCQSLQTTGTSSNESAGQGNHGDKQASVPAFTHYPNKSANIAAQRLGQSQQNTDNGDKEDDEEEVTYDEPEEEDEDADGDDNASGEESDDEVPAGKEDEMAEECKIHDAKDETKREENTENQTDFDLELFDHKDGTGIDSILHAVGRCPLPALSIRPTEPAEENHSQRGIKPVGQSTMEAKDMASRKEQNMEDGTLLADSGCELASLTPVQNADCDTSSVNLEETTVGFPGQLPGHASWPVRNFECVLDLSVVENGFSNVGYEHEAGVEQLDSSTVDSSIGSILQAAIGCKLSALTPSPAPQGTQHIAGQPDKVKTLAPDSSSPQLGVHQLPQRLSTEKQTSASSGLNFCPLSLECELDRGGNKNISQSDPQHGMIPVKVINDFNSSDTNSTSSSHGHPQKPTTTSYNGDLRHLQDHGNTYPRCIGAPEEVKETSFLLEGNSKEFTQQTSESEASKENSKLLGLHRRLYWKVTKKD